MKVLLVLVLGCASVLYVLNATADTNSQKCWSHAMTQAEMDNCAQQDYKNEDAQLNQVYEAIQIKYQGNPSFLHQLRIAEGIWVKLRDAQLAMKYPPQAPGYYGSDCQMCQWEYLTELTNDRITQLNAWLNNPDDKDVCTGSIGETNSGQ